MDFDEAACLWRCAKQISGGAFVEIGRKSGGSTLIIAGAMGSGHLLSIDKAPENDELTLRDLFSAWSGTQELIIADSRTYETSREFDAAFIDGDHSYDAALHDYIKWGGRVKIGGLIIFHDMACSRRDATKVNGLSVLRSEILQRHKGIVELVEEVGSVSVFRKIAKDDTTYAQWKFNPGGLKIDKNASVVIVGNGPSGNERELGSKIDSFDEVVRFNGYVIPGFEQFIGTKTTIWSLHTKELPIRPVKDPDRTDRIVYVRGDTAEPMFAELGPHRIPLSFYTPIRTDVERRYLFKSGFMEREKRLLPTSGLVVICWLLQVFEIPVLHIVGFDHFAKDKRKEHHYWHNKAYRKPIEHDGDVEADMFADLERSGRIIRL